MRISILTNEYPPHVYGGAGVHVEYLTRELARTDNGEHSVEVRCFGDHDLRQGNLSVRGTGPSQDVPCADRRHAKVLDPMQRNIAMAAALDRPQIVHCHTWYTHLAGCMARELYGVPMVLTTHSLEPHRPWKREQLGSGYDLTTWLERTAYRCAEGVIAVSESMRRDVVDLYGIDAGRVRVIHNGIDVAEYRPVEDREVTARYGIDPARPYILFVGRITRQKGIVHLLQALPRLAPGTQVLLCASSPDTEAIGRETERLVDEARRSGITVLWEKAMVPRADIVPLYSQAAVFVCPSIYEPFGIINLEAMACGTPVVGSKVGGIVESVDNGRTGLLVPFAPKGKDDPAPADPEAFASDLAAAVNRLLKDEALREMLGRAARKRVVEHFGWDVIAARTLDFYRELVCE
jgi:alpha-maltose-1-phosphate synthase